jgi:AsmA family/AsmA-like C-terminal region
VQTTLLGLAIAIILALVAALVAPLVVDWNSFRASFEDEASRLTGLAVHIHGDIDARILPTPRIKLADIEIGEAGHGPQARAAGVELEVAAGPLLRGEIRATELRLLAPQTEIGLDRSGAIAWGDLAPSFGAEALTVSQLSVVDGRITLADAASGTRRVLQRLSFDGDVRSLLGPLHGAGEFSLDGETFGYRVSASRAEAGGDVRVKLGVDPIDRPLTTEIEGALSLGGGVPRFEGTLALARPAGAALAGGARVMSDPWQLTGKVRATPAAASLRDLALQYGPEERAVNFTGSAELTFGQTPHVNGEIVARQLDVDRMLAAPDVTHRPPLLMIRIFLEAFVGAVKPPLPVGLSVVVDALTVGGTAVQALHGNARFDGKEWTLDDVVLRAPGLTDVSLSGRLADGAQGFAFSGPARVESADLHTLVAWLEGRGDRSAGAAETLSGHADVTIAGDRMALDRLSARLQQEDVEGRIAYVWGTQKRPAALDGELRAPMLDVDALVAFANAAASDGALARPQAVALVLDVGRATFAGIEARRLDARIKFDAGVLHIDRLSVGDLGGAALDVSGSIDELSSQPRGRLTLDVDARTLEGLTGIAGKVAPRVADALRPLVARLAPVKLHGVVIIDHAAAAAAAAAGRAADATGAAGSGGAGGAGASVAKLDLSGSVGAARLALAGEATGTASRHGSAVMRVNARLDADDGGALLRLLALDSFVAVDQLPGQLTIAASGPLNGDVQIKGLAAAGGFSAAAEGKLNFGGDAPTGSLQLRASAADLRALQRTLTGQQGASGPVAASAIVGIAGADLSVTDLSATAGKSSVHGRLDLKLAQPLRVSGEVSADDVDATAIAAALLGLPGTQPASGQSWSQVPVGRGGFDAVDGEVAVTFARAALTPSLVARDLKSVVHFAPAEIAFRDLGASLAGGRLSGELSFRRDATGLAGQGRVALNDARAASFIAPGKTAIDGLLTVKLQGEGTGLSADALVGSLHGSGTVAIAQAQFAGIDPAAFDVAIRAADQAGAVDAAKIRAAVGAAMDNGRLAVPSAAAEVTIAGGQVRLAGSAVRAPSGAELALDGVVDLTKATIDTRMTLAAPPMANALIPARPELAVTVKGPLAAPERQLDVSALMGWLALRAAEQQTRRLESVEANRRDDALGMPLRPPPPPSIRTLPAGTALEVTNYANAAPSPAGGNGLDRLRPELPAVTPLAPSPGAIKPSTTSNAPASPGGPAADKTTAAAGAAPPPQPPTLRSLLNSLFGAGSQN